MRRIVRDRQIELTGLPGTGLGGRVTRDDVLAHLQPRLRVVPFDAVRRRTAQNLSRSKATAAHAFVSTSADYTGVDAARRVIESTALPFVARAVVDALTEHPWLNARVDRNETVRSDAVHLGIAVDLAHEGLVVPVVHDAQDLRLRALARVMRDLARRARERRLTPDDVVGATFTLTNPGGYGTFLSVPIIPLPSVAILSTDGVRRRPVATRGEGDALAVRSVGMLGLSFDARAVTAGEAAGFVNRVAELLTARDWHAET